MNKHFNVKQVISCTSVEGIFVAQNCRLTHDAAEKDIPANFASHVYLISTYVF